MTKLTVFAAAIAAAISYATPAAAEGNFAIGIGGGTPGGSLEGQFRLNDTIRLRAGANTLAFDADAEIDDIEYTGELDFTGGGAFADLHPFQNSFFITGGVYFGEKSIGLSAEPMEDVTIGDVVFTAEEYGRLEGSAEFEEAAPFLGLGFDNTFTGDGNWGFRGMAGVALFGSAEVELASIGGTLSNDPTLLAEIEAEVESIESDVEDYDLYPIIQIGLFRRF